MSMFQRQFCLDIALQDRQYLRFLLAKYLIIPVTKNVQKQAFRSRWFEGKQPAECSLPVGIVRERCFQHLLLRFYIALRRLQDDFGWRGSAMLPHVVSQHVQTNSSDQLLQ